MNLFYVILTTLALGAMAGVSGMHYQQVKQLVEEKSEIQQTRDPATIHQDAVQNQVVTVGSSRLLPASRITSSAPSLTSKKIKKVVSSPQKLPRLGSRLSAEQRDSMIVELLMKIRQEQKNIHAQMANTNRNLDELTFRVDTYSTQFRPLRVQESRPRALIVPEDDYGTPSMGGADQLLPPKQ